MSELEVNKNILNNLKEIEELVDDDNLKKELHEHVNVLNKRIKLKSSPKKITRKRTKK